MYVFWHIGALAGRSHRLVPILARQWALLQSTDLLEACEQLCVGIVGPERPPILSEILAHPRVRIVAEAARGHENVTTEALRAFAANLPPQARVLYFHSRGVTRNVGQPQTGPADDWTKAIEYFVIERWREASAELDEHQTCGCHLFAHGGHGRVKRPFYHYSGNFWWARAGWLAALPKPSALMATDSSAAAQRYLAGEDWVLAPVDANTVGQHKNLHAITHNSYAQRYPRERYAKQLK